MLNNTLIATNVNITQDFDVDVQHGQVVWKALESAFQDYEIFFFDGTKTIQISDNQTDQDFAPKVSNGQVVWSSINGTNAEIYLYNGSQTIQLTNNTANDLSPEISNGKVLWYQYQSIPNTQGLSQAEIFFYDGTQTVQITNNQVDDRNAQFSGDSIVWEQQDTVEKGGDYEILLYRNGQTQRLTDNQTEDSLKAVEGNNILWTSFNRLTNQNELFLYDGTKTLQLSSNGFEGNFDTDGQSVAWIKDNSIYLYDGTTTKQITDGSSFKFSVQVSGNQVVWIESNQSTNYNPEVFLYDGIQSKQLTNDNEAFSKYNLQIQGENIVWQKTQYNASNFTYNSDIYIYRNGAVSPLVTTNQDDNILVLGDNQLIGFTLDPYVYYLANQVFLATWTDDTFPVLAHPEQYGASYPDLIEAYGYNLDAFNQHYRQYGLAEGRSIDNFDEFKYLASNPDLIDVYGADSALAARHYIEYGYAEQRPLNTFDALQYIASNYDLIYSYGGYDNYYGFQEPDLAGATRHYVQYGYSEDRPTDTFNELSYLAANPDLIERFGFDLTAVTKYYVQRGYYEYRPLTFDASEYLASNTDLINPLNGDRTLATEHYITSGYSEDRPTNSFDPIQYIASYSDLITQFGTGGDEFSYPYNGINIKAATDQFVDQGYQEGRVKDSFDEYRYIASNLDLIYIYGGNYVNGEGATIQYIQYGSSENRPTTSFDPNAYLQANPDVAQAYHNDPNLATLHYIQYGYFEGRPAA